jgi:hypothetical protein
MTLGKCLFCGLAVVTLAELVAPSETAAQGPMVVSAYYPPPPVVTYLPERRGLFGQRLVYRPVVTTAVPGFAVPVSPPVVFRYAPPVAVPAFPVQPAAVMVPVPPPVVVRFAPPPPVVTYYPPAIWP